MERFTGGKRKGLTPTPLAVFAVIAFLFQVTPSSATQAAQDTVPVAALEVVHRAAVPAAELIEELKTRSEAHAFALSDLGAVRAAVDQELVDFDAPLKGAKEVALFPPMTGG